MKKLNKHPTKWILKRPTLMNIVEKFPNTSKKDSSYTFPKRKNRPDTKCEVPDFITGTCISRR